MNIYMLFFYKSSRFKHDHIQQIRKQPENDYIPQESENLRFAPIIIFKFLIG